MSTAEKILEDALLQIARRTCGHRECPRLRWCHTSPHSCVHAKTAIAITALATYRRNVSALKRRRAERVKRRSAT